MADFIQMYHPDRPGSITWVEREAFREYYAHFGWTSGEDPGGLGARFIPGTELDAAVLETDVSKGTTTFGEITSTARITLPAVSQPIELHLVTQVTVTGTAGDEWTVGFVPVSGIGSILNVRGARRVTPPVIATGGLGLKFEMVYRLPSPVTAGDWTIAAQRETGTASTGINLKGNNLFNGFFAAVAR